MRKNPGRRERLKHTTPAAEGKKVGDGTGFRHGQHGQRFGLKGNRSQKSKHKMRTGLGQKQ